MKVVVSAPGKVILSGEHAVVYGKPEILAAINKRMTITLETGKDGVRISGKSDIPIGSGLGSSAAFSVVCTTVVNQLYKLRLTSSQINSIAYDLEKKYHGTPSGADNTAVTIGGFIWYRKEFEFLKNIWQLPMKLAKPLDHFVLINSGKPKETTGEMVQKIKNQRSKIKDTNQTSNIFNDIEVQTKKMLVALRGESEKDLKASISENERLLEKLGVVGQKAKKIIRSVEKLGGVAKITGAGGVQQGSGMLLCYHKMPEALIDLASLINLKAFRVKLGTPGLKVQYK